MVENNTVSLTKCRFWISLTKRQTSECKKKKSCTIDLLLSPPKTVITITPLDTVQQNISSYGLIYFQPTYFYSRSPPPKKEIRTYISKKI